MVKCEKTKKLSLFKIAQVTERIKQKYNLTHILATLNAENNEISFEMYQRETTQSVLRDLESLLGETIGKPYKTKSEPLQSSFDSENVLNMSTVLCIFEEDYEKIKKNNVCGQYTTRHHLKLTQEHKAKLLYLGGNDFIRQLIDNKWDEVVNKDLLAKKIDISKNWDVILDYLSKRRDKRYNEKLKKYLLEIFK